MNKKRIDALSKQLEPTDQQKKRMLENIRSEAAGAGYTPERKFIAIGRTRNRLITAALICCLLTTTVFAASYLGLDKAFLQFLKPVDEKQEKALVDSACVVDKQVVNKGGTLNIRQVIGDKNQTYILMDFTAEEGVVLDADRYRFDPSSSNFNISSTNSFYGWEFTKLEDETEGDNKITMVMGIQAKESLVGKKMTLELADLQGAGPFPETFRTTVSGKWKVSFDLDFQDISTEHELNQTVDLFGYKAQLTSLSISPISITLKMNSPDTKKINDAAGQWEELSPNEYSDLYPIIITYEDGTSEETGVFNGMHYMDALTGDILLIKTFEGVINDKKIKSIQFFGTELL